MPKTLLEVFEPTSKRSYSKNRKARSMGARTEALLVKELQSAGYEVRRTHLSAFPDIIAWSNLEILFIEVKARSDHKGLIQAKSFFKNSARQLTKVPDLKIGLRCYFLCYVRLDNDWHVFKYKKYGNWDEVTIIDNPLKLG